MSFGLAGGGADRSIDRREPVVAVGLRAAGNGEKLFLELAGDRSGDTLSDLDMVDRTDWGDFHRRADEEHFVHDVKHFSRNDRFLDGEAEIFGELHHRVASDAGKNAGSERR